jgi:protein tyrosine phosphatase (PTP) superfamily phosphohydrolase (DUF442 family)
VGAVVIAAVLITAVAIWARWRHVENRYRFEEVTAGELYRSRQVRPHRADDLEEIGVRTVINLRTQHEDEETFEREKQALAERDIEMVHIPMVKLLPSDEQLVRFLRAVGRPGAALVHCEHGRSRTGITVAAYRVLMEREDPQAALDEANRMAEGDQWDEDEQTRALAYLRWLAENRGQWLRRIATRPATRPTTRAALEPAGSG